MGTLDVLDGIAILLAVAISLLAIDVLLKRRIEAALWQKAALVVGLAMILSYLLSEVLHAAKPGLSV